MIDLSTCQHGQPLKTKHGAIVLYDCKLNPAKDYYDHRIIYENGGKGTRTNDGAVYRNQDKGHDLDIVEILPMGQVNANGESGWL